MIDPFTDRRTFLGGVGGAALSVALGRSLLGGLASQSATAGFAEGSIAAPSIGWAAAAAEAWGASAAADARFLHHFHVAGGVDDPRDRTSLIPTGAMISENLSALDLLPPWTYELAKEASRQRWYRDARNRDAAWAATPCVPSEVATLSTGELRSRLLALGIDAAPDRFFALVNETVSPWSISERWLSRPSLSRPEQDFVGLAAWELWQRPLCRHQIRLRPHDEQLDDWAYAVMPECNQDNPLAACDFGLRAWRQLVTRFSSETSTTEAADLLWAGSLPFANFVPALARRLRVACSTEPRFGPVARAVIEDALAQFHEEDDDFVGSLKSELTLLSRGAAGRRFGG